MKQSTSYTLGLYIGQYIFDKYLPTLSTDDILTPNVTQVSPEDTTMIEFLNKTWYESTPNGDNPDPLNNPQYWDAYLGANKTLRERYLPKILECQIPFLSLRDNHQWDELKKGIFDFLWDSDRCYYEISPKALNFRDDDVFVYLDLKLGYE
jgi:hypothetical protein